MNPKRRAIFSALCLRHLAFVVIFLACSDLLAAQDAGKAISSQPPAPDSQQIASDVVCNPAKLGSPFIPVDSWVYPAMWRLYALGYVDTVYFGIRPWTRASIAHMLEETATYLVDAGINDPAAQEAQVFRPPRMQAVAMQVGFI